MQSNVFCSQYETGAGQMQCMQSQAEVSHCPVSQVGDSGGCPVATAWQLVIGTAPYHIIQNATIAT